MICRQITEQLEKTYPPSIAERWDNPGLIVGRYEKEVRTVYVALDATDAVVGHALEAEADLLLTHHPMLLDGIKKINDSDFTGRRLIRLLQNDLCYYAMHTNYDIVRMAPDAAERLALSGQEVLAQTCVLPDGTTGGFGRIGSLPKTMTLARCADYVKEVFGLSHVKVFGDPKTEVTRAAVLPGSGKSMVGDAVRAGADVYISGDFGHHDGIDAVDQGLCVIDAGHDGIEHIYIGQMQREMQERFPELEILAEPVKPAFQIL